MAKPSEGKLSVKHPYYGMFLALYGVLWFALEYIGYRYPMGPILLVGLGIKYIIRR